MKEQEQQIRIKIHRQRPEDEKSLITYSIQHRKGMSVLDALEEVRRQHDASLAFPCSCRHGKSCRMCLAEVNGKVAYLCSTPAKDEMVVKPVPNRLVIRDLITAD